MCFGDDANIACPGFTKGCELVPPLERNTMKWKNEVLHEKRDVLYLLATRWRLRLVSKAMDVRY